MARGTFGIEPAPGIGSYDEVAWFRKQWFVLLMLFFFWPAMVIVLLTGDAYTKATKKTRKVDDAEVWRYTGGGKALAIASAVVFAVAGVIQILVLISSEDSSGTTAARPAVSDGESIASSGDGSDADAEVPVELGSELDLEPQDSEIAGASGTTVVPNESNLVSEKPALGQELLGGFESSVDEAKALVIASFENDGLMASMNSIAPRFAGVPVAEDAVLESWNVGAEVGTGRREGEVKFNAFVVYSSLQSVEELVALYQEGTPLVDLPAGEIEVSTDAKGEHTNLDFGSFSSHPDPDIDWSHLSVRVRENDEDDDGRVVRLSYTVNTELGSIPPNGSLGRIGLTMPRPRGYVLNFVELSGNNYGSDVSGGIRITTETPSVVVDDAAEIALIAAAFLDTGEWTVKSSKDDSVVYEFSADEYMFSTSSIGYKSDESTSVYNSFRFDT